ncbi:hypothetical protein [Alkalilacustris brevis]|uniref:hypothetical protein n=1 Tax=Alkalilacustris brevis TaxID=2026338 RepID=UPI000E0CDC86|nr:hypothetical protein [Alkalilacustris brevis]
MKSNGFGSYIQEIVVHVPQAQAEEAAKALRAQPFAQNAESGRSFFRIERLTRKQGDDEGVVFDLSHDLPAHIDWAVDWGQSDY